MTHVSDNQRKVVEKPISDEGFRILGLSAGWWTIVVAAAFIIFLPQQLIGWANSISGWASKIL